MRLFTALDPPPGNRPRYAELQNALPLTARWSDPEQFHVTVRFIGEIEEADFSEYAAALTDLQASAAHCVPYGLDVLPSRRAPRVVVLGLERTSSLVALHDAVTEALAPLGLDPEDRTYRPHLTLGRLSDPDPTAVHEALRRVDAPRLSPFSATTLHLYESTRTPSGAIHERRLSVPLQEQPA